jgi:hypothetical protein
MFKLMLHLQMKIMSLLTSAPTFRSHVVQIQPAVFPEIDESGNERQDD